MEKKERRIVFAVGLVLLLIFTFTDLQISMAIANKPGWARIFEVVGEIPFTALTVAACALLFRFRTQKTSSSAYSPPSAPDCCLSCLPLWAAS